MVIREDQHTIIVTSSPDGFGESCTRQHDSEKPVISLSRKTLSSCFKPSKIAPNALPSRPKLMARQYSPEAV
jgi:hypothetical protein